MFKKFAQAAPVKQLSAQWICLRNKLAPHTQTLLGLLFFSVTGLMLCQVLVHDMWRDELQAWDIARDSANFRELFYNLSFEGFPPLWHILLMGLQVFSHNPVLMQAVHAGIAVLNLYLIWRYASLPPAVKFVLMLSYPLTIQYAVFSRCYALVVTFALGALIAKEKKRPMLYWLMLGLTGQTTILGICVASALALQQLLAQPKETLRQWRGVAVFVVLTLFALWVAMPNADRLTVHDIGAHPTIYAFFMLLNAIVSPFQNFYLTAYVTLLVLWFDWAAIVSFLAMVGAFLIVNQLGYPLLHYHLMLVPLGLVFVGAQAGTLKNWWATCSAVLLFASMALWGANGLWQMPALPYSQGHAVARWIEKQNLKEALWIAAPDYAATTVSGYLDRPFYYTQCQCVAAAPHWSKKSRKIKPFAEEIAIAENVMREKQVKVAYFLAATAWQLSEFYAVAPANMTVEEEGAFLGASVPDEQFIVFKLTLHDG